MIETERKLPEATFHERYPLAGAECYGCHHFAAQGYMVHYDEDDQDRWVCVECRKEAERRDEIRLSTWQALLDKPARAVPWAEFRALRPSSLELNMPGMGEGQPKAYLVGGDRGHELWLPASRRGISDFRMHFECYDGRAKPFSCREAFRFWLGRQFCVRVGAGQWDGKLHFALPTAPEALEFIHFYEVVEE